MANDIITADDLVQYGGRDLTIEEIQMFYDRFVSKELFVRYSENIADALKNSAETDKKLNETDLKLNAALDKFMESLTTVKEDHEKRITLMEVCNAEREKQIERKVKKYGLMIAGAAFLTPLAIRCVEVMMK